MSSALVALQLDVPQHSETWYVLDLLCLLIFSLEVLIRLCAQCRSFFKEFWNNFDIVLLLFNFVDLLDLIPFQDVILLRILRGMKVFRMLRLFKVLPEIRRVSSAITESISSMTWGFALLIIVLYMGGILSTVALRDTEEIYPGFARQEQDWDAVDDFNPVMYFGSVFASMYTLFNLAIQTEFAEFARAIWIKQPLLFLSLAVFACCMCFGLQNFVITACVERAADIDRQMNDDATSFIESQKLETLKDLMMVLFGSHSKNEVLTQGKLTEALEDSEMRDKLKALEFPVSLSSAELFLLLDDTGTGEIPHEDFMRNAVRLIASSTKPFEGHCLLQLTMNRIMTHLRHLERNEGIRRHMSGDMPGDGSNGGSEPGLGSACLGSTKSGLGSACLSDSSDFSHLPQDEVPWAQRCRLRAKAAHLTSSPICTDLESSSPVDLHVQDAVHQDAVHQAASGGMSQFQSQLRDTMQRFTEEVLALAGSAGLAEMPSASVEEKTSSTGGTCGIMSPVVATSKGSTERLPVLLGKATQPIELVQCAQQPSFGPKVERSGTDTIRDQAFSSEGSPSPSSARSSQDVGTFRTHVPRMAVYLAEKLLADRPLADRPDNHPPSKATHVRFESGQKANGLAASPSVPHRMTRPKHSKNRTKSPKGTRIGGAGIGLWFSSISSPGEAAGRAPAPAPEARNAANPPADHEASTAEL
mmetsp:Transcript_50332/g.87503  ORF Transcript_50332/g.87503 Transcript_50332/m.87503 type:complete len:700 (+) Transcript_50332:126-2225(+)